MEDLIQKLFDSPKVLLAITILLVAIGWGLLAWDVIDLARIITG